jgi:predicted nucleic acid-binding protein
MKRWLVDTGPLVAYLDRMDPMHELVAARLEGFSGQLATTGAVVTEVMHFVSDALEGPTSVAEFLASSNTQVVEAMQPSQILAAAALMKKYVDTPMDFADATLVALGERLGLAEILTLDRRGFSTYRTPTGKKFRLVLDAV